MTTDRSAGVVAAARQLCELDPTGQFCMNHSTEDWNYAIAGGYCDIGKSKVESTYDVIAAAVRAQVAAEIEAKCPEMGRNINISPYRDGINQGMLRAANIARGGAK